MANLANALNGGKVQLWADTGSGFEFIGGQTAHSKTMTFEPIDISNKALPETREYLEGEGKNTVDVTSEIIWSTDSAYQFVRGKADSKLSFPLEIRYDNYIDKTLQFDVLVLSVGENNEQNTAVSNSVTLSSTGSLEYYPYTLDLNFGLDTYLESGVFDTFANTIDFTRATTSTYWGRDLVGEAYVYSLKTADIDEPCLAFDPETGEPLGLQVFGSSTNLLAYSEQFTGGWGTYQTLLLTANVTSPADDPTVEKLYETADSGQHRAETLATVTAGSAYTFSVFAKAGERKGIQLRSIDDSAFGEFDLESGTLLSNDGEMVSCGNGWYRCSVTGVMSDTATPSRINILDDSFNDSYTGDGSSGLYIWGAQLEQKECATPYIKTVSSQVTRAADIAKIENIDTAGWYNQNAGSVFVEVSAFATVAGAAQYLLSLSDGSSDNRLISRQRSSSGTVDFNVISGGVAASEVSTVEVSLNTKLSTSFGGELLAAVNGGFYGDSSINLPTFNLLSLGTVQDATGHLNGYIKQLKYYPTALSENQLKALTK